MFNSECNADFLTMGAESKSFIGKLKCNIYKQTDKTYLQVPPLHKLTANRGSGKTSTVSSID